MTRFGTVLLVAGLMLAGCDQQKLGWPTDEPVAKKTAAANCPPPTASACPPVAEAAKTQVTITEKTTRVVRKRKAKVRVHRTYERDASSGLAGGGSYRRYEEREYARVEPGERAYRRYEGSTGSRRGYEYESRESSSESSRSYAESSSSAYGYGYGMAEGGYGGGFDPRRERYYAAGRDSRGYLVWPGKR